MVFLENLFTKILFFFKRDKWKKMFNAGKDSAVLMEILRQKKLITPKSGPFLKHGKQDECVEKYTDSIKRHANRNAENIVPQTISFADSLMDFPRNKICSVPERNNFSMAGSWSHHMGDMASLLQPILEENKVPVGYVVVGCLGGNPLLVCQEFHSVISEAVLALEKIRKLFPYAKMIVYGLPPCFNIWAMMHHFDFEKIVYNWVRQDGNAVFLPLQSKFGGFMGLIPRIEMSVDGVHFSRKGVMIFDKLLNKAKKAKAGSIVD